MRRLTLIAACVLAVAACKGSGPSCAELTDHILDVTMAAMPAHGGMKMANKQQMTQHCANDLSVDERKCMMDAKDLATLGTCRKQVVVPQPPPAAPATPPPPPTPSPPPPTGGSGSAP